MSKKDFVTFLVDETFKLQKNGTAGLSSLELKLNDYGLHYMKGEFIPQAQILRFNTSIGLLDIPVNWSIFSVENSLAQYTLLDETNDRDCFYQVIKSAWDSSIQKLLITHDDGFCYIVGLKTGEESRLRDIVSRQDWLKTA